MLDTLKEEVRQGNVSLETLREEWRADREATATSIIGATKALNPDIPLPTTLHGLLDVRVADESTSSTIASAMAARGVEPHLSRLVAFQGDLFTFGIANTTMFEMLANAMLLSYPDSCSCGNRTLAGRWLHNNHGVYNQLVKDLVEGHNYRERLRNVLRGDAKRHEPITTTSRQAELDSFLKANADPRWFMPTPQPA